MVARDPRGGDVRRTAWTAACDNPLGARALYLWQGNKDTLYRLHGTNEPSSIGKAVSSGCVRMLNQDIIDLYERVPLGTKVVVLGVGHDAARRPLVRSVPAAGSFRGQSRASARR